MTTMDNELFAILITVSILLYVILMDGMFLYHKIKNKIMGKGKKNENTGESKCCENWDGKNGCVNNADNRNECSS